MIEVSSEDVKISSIVTTKLDFVLKSSPNLYETGSFLDDNNSYLDVDLRLKGCFIDPKVG